MLKRFFTVILLIFILFIDSLSNLTEIETIEDYSKQFLEEVINNENTTIQDEIKQNSNNNEEVIEIYNQNSTDEEETREENKELELTFIPNEEDLNNKVDKVEWYLKDNFRSAIIGDKNGNIVFSRNADKFYPLASLTKVMTLLVTFDEIKAGRVKLTDRVKISKDIAEIGGSRIPLKAGETYLLEDLIKASAIYSANNATYAIAKHVGKGSVSDFVKKMNHKVKKLGLEGQLKYYTPAGLPSRMTKKPMDSGTARGIYRLSIEALKYKKYIQIASMKKTKIHNDRITIRNRNHLLGQEGVFGIKTGYHKEAKYNITVASNKNDITMITVVLGGNSYKDRDATVLKILDIFNNNYERKKIIDKNEAIGYIDLGEPYGQLNVYPDKNLYKLVQKGKNYKIVANVRENLKLDIFVGEKIGYYEVYDGDKLITKGNLISKQNIKK